MNEKYTIGDLAKEAGISTKAIRIYEKKGLIKPTGYSEGNYRLYDNNARIILQKIIMLKFVGFSLDEIGVLLEKDKNNDILKSLSEQKQLLELKRNKIDRIIYCVDRAAERCAEGEIDWDSFTEIMRAVIIDRNADEGHWAALKYGINKEDWYAKIFKNINIVPNDRVLDIGCGYGKLWRNNWSNIPESVKVTTMDLHGTWADDFAKYVANNCNSLQGGTSFEFVWENVENEDSITGKYNKIVANYLFMCIKEPVRLLQRIKAALANDGVLYCINGSSTLALETIATLLKDFDSALDDISMKIIQKKSKNEAFKSQLSSVFDSVESLTLENGFVFNNTNEFYEFLIKKEFAVEYNLEKRKEEFKDYLSELIKKEGKIIIPSMTLLYCCR